MDPTTATTMATNGLKRKAADSVASSSLSFEDADHQRKKSYAAFGASPVPLTSSSALPATAVSSTPLGVTSASAAAAAAVAPKVSPITPLSTAKSASVSKSAKTTTTTTSAKKKKIVCENNVYKENDEYELVLVWTDDCDEERTTSLDRLLPLGTLEEHFGADADFSFSEEEEKAPNRPTKGEWNELHFELRLLDKQKMKKSGKNQKEATLYGFGFMFWPEGSHAHLQNFNECSGDLANFCFDLWCAAGRKRNQYNDMAIEMGSSPHCRVPVNVLMADAWNRQNNGTVKNTRYNNNNKTSGDDSTAAATRSEINYWSTCYIDVPTSFDEEEHLTRDRAMLLLNGLLHLLGPNCTTIVHENDLSKLRIYSDDDIFARLGLQALKKGRGWSGWHVAVPDAEW